MLCPRAGGAKTISLVGIPTTEFQRNNNLVFKQGAEALGLNGAFLARSAPGCVGCGICQYGCPSGGKLSVDRTFLSEALATGRGAAWSDCRIRGVETDGDRVIAVTGDVLDPETHEGVGSLRATADTFVISGGPIGSPLFLLANGLADNTHCGQHLEVHPTVGSLARFPWEIKMWSGVTQGYYVDCWDRGFLLQTYTCTPDQYFIVLQTRMGSETMEIMGDLATLCAEVFFAAGAIEAFPGRIGLDRIRSPADIAAALPYDIPASQLMLYASPAWEESRTRRWWTPRVGCGAGPTCVWPTPPSSRPASGSTPRSPPWPPWAHGGRQHRQPRLISLLAARYAMTSSAHSSTVRPAVSMTSSAAAGSS